jgi:predicted DsbA family dithiol-disulfide isomerase
MAASMAIASPHVRADIIEASEFPDLAQRYNVYAVPKTVINEHAEVVGALPEPNFLKAVIDAVTPSEAPPAAAPSGQPPSA